MREKRKTVAGVIGVFLLVASLYIAVFSTWMIDVSVGAISVNGCVTQGVNCVNPMIFYHTYLRILTGAIFLVHAIMGALIVLFLRH